MESIESLQSIQTIQVNLDCFDVSELKNHNIIQTDNGDYFVLLEGKSIPIKLIKTYSQKYYNIAIDQKSYEVKLNRVIDHRIKEMGYDKVTKKLTESILAPMPGLVKRVLVSIGDEVMTGQDLFTLEAMKMENIIKSPHPGIVKSIPVNPGAAVEKNQVLLTF